MSSMVLYMTVILRTQCKLMTYVNSLITLKCLHSIKLDNRVPYIKAYLRQHLIVDLSNLKIFCEVLSIYLTPDLAYYT